MVKNSENAHIYSWRSDRNLDRNTNILYASRNHFPCHIENVSPVEKNVDLEKSKENSMQNVDLSDPVNTNPKTSLPASLFLSVINGLIGLRPKCVVLLLLVLLSLGALPLFRNLFKETK